MFSVQRNHARLRSGSGRCLPPMFMINFSGLIILSLVLPGAARRSFRIEDSRRDDAQQQNKMLTKDFEVSADGKDAFIPTGQKKMFFPKAKKTLSQENALARFPSAMMYKGYGRWTPKYDFYDMGAPWGPFRESWEDWGEGYGRYSRYEEEMKKDDERFGRRGPLPEKLRYALRTRAVDAEKKLVKREKETKDALASLTKQLKEVSKAAGAAKKADKAVKNERKAALKASAHAAEASASAVLADAVMDGYGNGGYMDGYGRRYGRPYMSEENAEPQAKLKIEDEDVGGK